MGRLATVASFLALFSVNAAASEKIPEKYLRLFAYENASYDRRSREVKILEGELERLKGVVDEQEELLDRMKRGMIRITLTKIYIPKNKNELIKFPSTAQKNWYLNLGRNTIAATKESIKRVERKINSIQNSGSLSYPNLPSSAKTGDIGYAGTMKVIQVVGDDMLVDFIRRKTFLAKGFSTTNVVDDQFIDLGLVEVTGRATYKNILGGTRTVFVIEPVDQSELNNWRQVYEKSKLAKKKD